jgi:dTDP-4-dehydrorhamnose 3,5-epimerase
MQITATALPEVKIVQLTLHRDDRGFFVERFSATRFAEAGLPENYAQDNHSRSHPGVLRGLHYQYEPAQGKLVGVTRGRIWDVAVDIRPGSPNFGRHVGVELSDDNGRLLWVPAGFAHGFCVLGDEAADVFYKVDAPYNGKAEGGIRWDDPDLAIEWPVKNPQVSTRDTALMGWKDYQKTHEAGVFARHVA